MNNLEIQNLYYNYYPELNSFQTNLLIQLAEELRFWNSRINLISRRDINHLEIRHIIYSLTISKLISFRPETFIVDFGTGGGFPGLPLAVMFPSCRFLLVDSIGKKIKAVKEMIRSLKLKNAESIQDRVEKIKYNPDFFVCRAVASFPKLIAWTRGRVNSNNRNKIKNGLICLKGGDLSNELQYHPNIMQIELKEYFIDDFFLSKKILYSPL